MNYLHELYVQGIYLLLQMSNIFVSLPSTFSPFPNFPCVPFGLSQVRDFYNYCFIITDIQPPESICHCSYVHEFRGDHLECNNPSEFLLECKCCLSLSSHGCLKLHVQVQGPLIGCQLVLLLNRSHLGTHTVQISWMHLPLTYRRHHH